MHLVPPFSCPTAVCVFVCVCCPTFCVRFSTLSTLMAPVTQPTARCAPLGEKATPRHAVPMLTYAHTRRRQHEQAGRQAGRTGQGGQRRGPCRHIREMPRPGSAWVNGGGGGGGGGESTPPYPALPPHTLPCPPPYPALPYAAMPPPWP